MNDLGKLCDQLIAKSHNLKDFDQLIITSLDLFLQSGHKVCDLVRDPQISVFIQLIVRPFFRVSSDIDSETIVTISSSLKQLCLYHPIYRDIVAANIPFETVLIQAKDIRIYSLLADLSMSPFLNFRSHDIFKTLLSLTQKPEVSNCAFVILTGIVKSFPQFAALVRSSLELKEILTNAVSADDHLSAIASIYLLLVLFPRSLDLETAKRVALHAISVVTDDATMLTISSWILCEIARERGVSGEEINELLKVALQAPGMCSYVLFEYTNRLIAMGSPKILTNIEVNSILRFVLDQKCGFVGVAAVRIIEHIAEQQDNIFDGIDDPVAIARQALELSCSPPGCCEVEMIECGIMILKFLTQSETTWKAIETFLRENEENIFLGFQRSIEANRSFVALGLFLLILSASRQIDGWKKRLRLLVIDSQFTGLLAYIIGHSTDRRTLLDAIRAVSEITMFSSDIGLLMDNLVSGFAAVNDHTRRNEKIRIIKDTDFISRQGEELSKLRNELQQCHTDVQSYAAKVESYESSKNEIQGKLNEYEAQLISKNTEILSFKETISNQCDQLKKLEQQNESLQGSNKDLNVQLNQRTLDVERLTSELKAVKENDHERVQVERKNAEQGQKIAELERSIENLTRELEQQRKRADDYKSKVQTLKSAFLDQTNSINEEIKAKERKDLHIQQLSQQLEQCGIIEARNKKKFKKLKERLSAIMKDNQATQEENSRLRNRIIDLENMKKGYLSQINELSDSHKQFELITQFVHRITDEKTIPSESLLNLFHD